MHNCEDIKQHKGSDRSSSDPSLQSISNETTREEEHVTERRNGVAYVVTLSRTRDDASFTVFRIESAPPRRKPNTPPPRAAGAAGCCGCCCGVCAETCDGEGPLEGFAGGEGLVDWGGGGGGAEGRAAGVEDGVAFGVGGGGREGAAGGMDEPRIERGPARSVPWQCSKPMASVACTTTSISGRTAGSTCSIDPEYRGLWRVLIKKNNKKIVSVTFAVTSSFILVVSYRSVRIIRLKSKLFH